MKPRKSANESHAEKCVNNIMDFWKRRGYHVNVWIEKGESLDNGALFYDIKSDLKNAMPQRRAAK